MREVLDALERRLTEPTTRGLVTAASAAMREGALAPGTRLPPIRTVAVQLGLSPTTVSAAWSLLARSGAIRTDGRRGTTVTDIRAAPARYRRVPRQRGEFRWDLSTGIPAPELLPDLRPALRRLTTAATPGSYLDVPVLPELLDVLGTEWPYPSERFLLTDGAMDAVELIMRAIVRVGDQVIVEDPGFPPLLDLIDALGARAVGVGLDADGIVPGQLASALSAAVAAVIVQPRAQNPTGVSTSPSRAQQLAEVLTASTALIVEDDSAGAIASAAPVSIGRWLPERTVHIRSFSKSHGPDLRLAAVSGPAELITELDARRQLGQGWSSRLLQRILLHLLTDARAVDQVASARSEYARRRRSAVRTLAAHGIEVGGNDGINIWVPVEDEAATVVQLASRGIGVAPGTPFTVLSEQLPHIRVTSGLLAAADHNVLDQIASAAHAQASTVAR